MSFIRDTRSVEQQYFFDGQRLFADDLQGIEAFNREMRWLHNQSLHQPGIGNGFAVAGKKGDREVTVGPGYAIDDLGREIVLTRDRVLPVPPVAGDSGVAARYLLTVAYPEGDLDIVEERQGVCADSGATRLRVEPVFCWQPLNPDGTPGNAAEAIVTGRQLTVAEIAVKDCKLDRDVKISTRRNARPASQPYIYAGEEKPTGWTPWIEPAPSVSTGFESSSSATFPLRLLAGFEAWIDTSEAGFLGPPEYFCRIDGERVFDLADMGDFDHALFALDGLVHIAEPTPDGFVARVMVFFLGFVSGHSAPFAAFESENTMATSFGMLDVEEGKVSLPWNVVWMGVEG